MKLKNFSFDIGWFSNEDFRIEFTIFENGNDFYNVFCFQIGKFVISFYYNKLED